MKKIRTKKYYMTTRLYLSCLHDTLIAINKTINDVGLPNPEKKELEKEITKIESFIDKNNSPKNVEDLDNLDREIEVVEDQTEQFLKDFFLACDSMADDGGDLSDSLARFAATLYKRLNLSDEAQNECFKQEIVSKLSEYESENQEKIDKTNDRANELSKSIILGLEKIGEVGIENYQAKKGITIDDTHELFSKPQTFTFLVNLLKGIFSVIGAAITFGSAINEEIKKQPTSRSGATKKAGLSKKGQKSVEFKCPNCKGWSRNHLDEHFVYEGSKVQCSCINCKQPIEGKVSGLKLKSRKVGEIKFPSPI